MTKLTKKEIAFLGGLVKTLQEVYASPDARDTQKMAVCLTLPEVSELPGLRQKLRELYVDAGRE